MTALSLSFCENMTMDADTKIEFRVESSDGVDVETLWASKLGDNRYKLLNCPFYAYRVSWGDIIEAIDQDRDGFPLFVRVLQKSGHRLIRIIFDSPTNQSQKSEEVLAGLVKMGCSYEGANTSYICLDIPPEMSLDEVARFLTQHQMQ